MANQIANQQHTLVTDSPYIGYVYGYPHKTAYRAFDPPVSLQDIWSRENQQSLFLYLHIPFCEQRCGFCNLFTAVDHDNVRPKLYVQALRRQAEQTIDALSDDVSFSRLAIGGGTPTYLGVNELEVMLGVLTQVLHVNPQAIPAGIEASPLTATPDRLALLRSHGIDRLSIGVQTFDAAESKKLGRTQGPGVVHRALQAIRDAKFPTLNIDLIYGGDGQDLHSWRATINQTLEYQPEEIYLYPLYVRPLTGLGRTQRSWDDQRLELYRAGREQLLDAGYRQVSMRMFQRGDQSSAFGPVYCCQRDGMVGLGCGARSYTSDRHYSLEYAVKRDQVIGIIDDYIQRDAASFRQVEFGFELDRSERRRRHVLMSLLQVEGLDIDDYQEAFASDVFDDMPQLRELLELDMALCQDGTLRLTPSGLERSDAIGPWLYSEAVQLRMEAYTWR